MAALSCSRTQVLFRFIDILAPLWARSRLADVVRGASLFSFRGISVRQENFCSRGKRKIWKITIRCEKGKNREHEEPTEVARIVSKEENYTKNRMTTSSNLRRRGNPSSASPRMEETSTQGGSNADVSRRAPRSTKTARGLSLILVACFAVFLAFILSGYQPSEKEEEEVVQNEEVVAGKGEEGESKEPPRSCRIYMAPSSVKGLDGFGVYITEPVSKGDFFFNGPDGPDILVTDYDYFPFNDTLARERAAWIRLFDGYWWGRGVNDMILYESQSNIDFQICFGSLPNHHCVLDAVDHEWPDPPYDDTMIEDGPGLGAFSYYRGRNFFATVSHVFRFDFQCMKNFLTSCCRREIWRLVTRSF